MANKLIQEKKPKTPPLREKPRGSGHPEVQNRLKEWATRPKKGVRPSQK